MFLALALVDRALGSWGVCWEMGITRGSDASVHKLHSSHDSGKMARFMLVQKDGCNDTCYPVQSSRISKINRLSCSCLLLSNKCDVGGVGCTAVDASSSLNLVCVTIGCVLFQRQAVWPWKPAPMERRMRKVQTR